MPFFDIFASPRWSPLRMCTKVASFFIFFQELSNKKKIKALRPKMAKIASRGGPALKGQCHDIQWFFALFCASKKWRLLAQVSRTSIWKLGRPRDLAAWPPTLAADMTVPCTWTKDKSSQSCTISLVDGDRQYFCFQATKPEQGDIPFFKVQD